MRGVRDEETRRAGLAATRLAERVATAMTLTYVRGSVLERA